MEEESKMYEITFRNIDTDQVHKLYAPLDKFDLSDTWLQIIDNYGAVIVQSINIVSKEEAAEI